ncbi:MAG: hypothetical protein JJLCMIEE_03201 [Acidimicrobiales bacterium]|nr:MAG: sulfite exporter TauE/SafE family protein [Actinomycetota bacterium]MBV6510081.1 hypothetical protein [Acidimicrobiales bacterium]RIK03575.1 MAG: permease [Acidobacteriota bacterium]
MAELILVGLAGFVAAMVDGALGMGFGPTSSTILLSTGLPPAAVSTTVNLAKVVSGLASGVSHWQFRNIDHGLVLRLAVPGALGALIGVTVLANVDAATLRPVLAVLLLLVGLRMLLRFSNPLPSRPPDADEVTADDPAGAFDFDDRGVTVAATAGGVTNGLIGAWGPVVTPFLLHRGLAPRYAIGSVNTAEVAVATVAAGSLMASVGRGGIEMGVVLAMMIGGVAAAPLAAWMIRHVPARAMGLAVAALLLVTNAREIMGWTGLGASRWVFYSLIPLLVAAAALAPRFRNVSDALGASEPSVG